MVYSRFGVIPRGSTHTYSLVYLPERRLLATFRYARHCRALAAELGVALPEPLSG